MKLRLALLAAVIALVSSACIRAEVDLVVAEDGTIVYGGVVAADPDAIARITELFGGLEELEDGSAEIPTRDEICADFVSEQGFDEMDDTEGVETSVEPYEEDGFCGVRFQVSGPFEQANELLAQGSSPVTLREEPDGGWFFELPLGDTGAGDAGDLAEFPGLGDVFDDARYIVRVKLPGRQVEHNATGITDDGTMVWDIDLLAPPGPSLFLRTEPGEPETGDFDGGDGLGAADGDGGDDDGGGNGLLIAIVVAALVALGAVAFVLLRRRRATPATSAGAPIPPGAPGAFTSTTPAGATGWDQTATAPQPLGVYQQAPAPAPTTPTPVIAPTPTEPTPVIADAVTVAPTDTPATPTPPGAPAVIASPSPEQATGTSVWDPVRRAYVQWNPAESRWMVFDDATRQWRAET